MDQSLAPLPGELGTEVSLMPPFRPPGFGSFPGLPLLAPFPLLVGFAWAMASEIAIAMEYVSSPVPQPALQIRRVPELSTALRAWSCGITCRDRAFMAPGCR